MLKYRVATRHAVIIAVLTFATACGGSKDKQEYFENANRLAAEKKYADAAVEYRNAINLDPRFGEARAKLAEVFEATGNDRGARNEYIRAADLLPDDVGVQLKASRYLLYARQFEDAKTRAQRVLDRDPNNVDAQVLVANAMAGLRDLDGAIREMEDAIQLDPDRGESYLNLGVIKLAKGQREQAKAAFEKAVEIEPSSTVALLGLANYQMSVGENTAAEQSLRRAHTLAPRDVMTNRMLAAFYVATGQRAAAEPHLKTVVEITGADAARLALADYYVQSRRHDDARAILQPLASQRTTATQAELRLARIHYVSKEAARAHEMLDTILKREPNNAPVHVTKARWLLAEGKRDEAAKHATAAATADAQSDAARYLLGTLRMAAGDTDGATAAFNEVLALNPRAAAAQVKLSQLQLARGNAEAAVQLARDAVTNAPDQPEARAALVRGLIARNELKRAEPEVVALLKEHPRAPAAHVLDGALRLAKNDNIGARRAYESALALDPRSLPALTGVTRVDVRERKMAQALARVSARITAEPNRPELLMLAARLNILNQDFAQAEALLRRLTSIDPSNTTAYGMLGQLYRQLGKEDAALVEFEAMARRNPTDVGALMMIASIMENRKNLAEAKKRYEQVLAINPRLVAAANNLAWLYADAGENLDMALKLAQTAAEQMPGSPFIQDTLGWVYYRKDLPKLAIPSFQQSIDKDPENPVYHYHLALAYHKAGDAERARSAAQSALRLKPDFADARKLLDSIQG